jgi:AAA+ superfamily predicted ATPase
MNIKKKILHILAPIIMASVQFIYTQDEQDHTTNQPDVANNLQVKSRPQDQNQYNNDEWKFIEETFQTICDQTSKIEFCLQQAEQILTSDKMKFNAQKISKAQLLQEIQEIKEIISMLFEFYSKNLEKDEAILKGTLFNTAFINYLLPIMQKDIAHLSADNFDKAVAQTFEELITNLHSQDQLPAMIEDNDANITLLIQACDNIGLTALNKVYRYLDTKQLPWYGKSTIATASDILFWGTMAAVATTFAIYVTPKDMKFPGIDGTFGDWKIKKWIADFHEKARELKANIPQDELKEIHKNDSYVSHAHTLAHTYSDAFTGIVLGVLGYFTLPHLKELYKHSAKKGNQLVNYYIKGDASAAKGSTDFTKAYFKDFVGGQHLEKLAHELADYLKNPTRYERSGIEPSNGYLLVGPSQTGKSFFAKALKTLIDEKFAGTSDTVKFAVVTQDDMDYFKGFANIFYWAQKNAPIILFIDEIDMYEVRRDRNAKNTQELLTAMNGIDTDPSKKVIVVAATNRPEELDFALKQKGRLGDLITFDYPTYESRKEYLEKQLLKKNIKISQNMIDIIAQETDGQTFNMLNTIVKHALRLATYQTRPVQESDFETALDREIRKIKPNTTLSASEKELVAIYQAGQAAARHILDTDQKIVKITTDTVDKPLKSKEGFGMVSEQKGNQHENIDLLPSNRIKPTRLGFIFTISTTNNHELLSDAQQEKELLALLAGQAAFELIKGSTYHEFGKEDRAKVLEALERKIAQGTPITDKIRLQAIAAKDILYQKIKTLLQDHGAFVKIITDELIKNSTIDQKQWIALTAQYIL